jgi:hypothetical protein
MGDPRLGWWVQLVDCSGFDNDVRMAVLGNWGRDLVGPSVCEIDWPEDNPMPNMLMMYGVVDDIPPDFDQMAEDVRQFMGDYQYFVFVFMKDTILAKGGLECIVITKHTVLRINGRLLIQSAIDSALAVDERWRESTERIDRE